MSTARRVVVRFAWPVVLLTTCTLAANSADPSEPKRVRVTAAASALIDQGLADAAPGDPHGEGFQDVPPPGLRFVASEAQATSAPWIDSNGWRFQRGVAKANYVRLPPGSAPLAAAEAFAFGVDAILNPDPADVEPLGDMLRFLEAESRPRLPVMANVGIVDDKSREMGEILNLLTRRNLLYRIVAEPDPALDLTVQLGTGQFPRSAADDPYEFAARVRAALGDDKRLVRIYGTNTLLAQLTGSRERARLYLLSFSQAEREFQEQPIRVRVLGRYRPVHVGVFRGAPDAALTDVDHPGDATEFFLPGFRMLAIVDLER